MKNKYDFGGWATKANIKCSDGRTIAPDAFKHHDGQKVPLVYNHGHSDPKDILGHAVLSARNGDLYAQCSFNNSENALTAKEAVKHGDVVSLSIYANKLRQEGGIVRHGQIREVSLVLAGANPGAYIDSIMYHGEDYDSDAAIIYSGDEDISHGDVEEPDAPEEPSEQPEDIEHADKMGLSEDEAADMTVDEILDTMTPVYKNTVYTVAGLAVQQYIDTQKTDNNEGDNEMKQNAFDQKPVVEQKTVLSHSDKKLISDEFDKTGSLKQAFKNLTLPRAESYKEIMHNATATADDVLEHAYSEIELLFPDFKNLNPGAPELITRDQTWVTHVMQKAHKSPASRLRTRQMDGRNANLRGKGYKKGAQKTDMGDMSLIHRTTQPQTVYVKDQLHRDDFINITEFDAIAYNFNMMRIALDEELAMAAFVGDGRAAGDADKIHETNIRPIWTDDEIYTIHKDVDIAATKTKLQGTNTGAYFGDNYVYAEAIIEAALDAKIDYKGSGGLDFYCTPQLLNKMLLARDRNGRRIYMSKADLETALNVGTIHTAEQFEGLTRTHTDGNERALLGFFVNMKDYVFGATKGGAVTKFQDFDININKELFLLETNLCGALTRIKSAIVLEEPVTTP